MQQKSEIISAVPSALSHFDQLPNSAYIRLPVLMALYGVSAATIWRGVQKGSIPAPKKMTQRTTAWNVGLIRAALAGEVTQSCQ